MQKQRIIILVVGVVLALLSLVMVMAYVDQQVKVKNDQLKAVVAKQLASQVAVLVAKTSIPKGSVIESSMLETAILPGQYVQPQAATSLDRVSGMMTIAPVEKGEQLVMSKLVISSQAASGGSLAMATPVGKRAITISVDNISSVAGMIRPGDYVDVIVTVPWPVQGADGKPSAQPAVVPLFQNVLVLAVGQETGTYVRPAEDRYKKTEKPQAASPLITLALGPQETSLLSFVQEQGKLKLVLRSPSDAKVESVPPASWETLFQYATPPEQIEAKQREEQSRLQAQKAREESGEYIEIYRGMKKDRLQIGK